MNKKQVKEISIELINKYLTYNGNFFIWNYRDVSCFASRAAYLTWNKKFQGKKAGTISPQGYEEIQINRSKYKVHRLVWCLHHGEIPINMQVDHINHIRSDNRIGNLRLVNQSQNQRNSTLRKDNKDGKPGVRWHSSQRKWHAFIRANGKQIHLGCFSDYSSAVVAREKAELAHGYHQNHGRN
ncbi:HNH endonuclease [Serratia sp. NPDC087055]|uniref:HNH endonuclease n=1 Tax=Serratia sp. NPDC087055 TaxID=3364516 RepID=UPI00384C9582